MKRFKNIFARLTLAALCGVALAGCDSVIYDDEGDCSYRIRFVFDKHLHQSDAFAYEVNAVTLYLVDDATGRIVWQKSESGPELKTGHYRMSIPDDAVPAGSYSMIAWCGDGVGTHFTVADDADHFSDLQCSLNRESSDEDPRPHSGINLNRLYHGRLDHVELTPQTTAQEFTVPLTKDTNDVVLLLHNLDGDPISPEDFTFQIVDANGLMDWDNSILPDDEIVYTPHHISYGSASTLGAPMKAPQEAQASPSASRVVSSYPMALAEFSIPRIMADRNLKLLVLNNDGDTTANLNIPKFALLVRGQNNLHFDPQDFLDRLDKVDLTLFLRNGRWQSAQINILSWQIVFDNYDI